MRFSIIALATPLLLAAGVLAGDNCKCQDSAGQYNEATQFCCDNQQVEGNVYHGDQVHQCSNAFGALNSGLFVECCMAEGHGGAFCW
ncbi:hypothetical protein Q9L58_006858 [Maublancomyces gigas]|uniref:Plethodontid modulating factor n=1 Tax=Discina gigas TaxID=1032678 RepID=A0ABR3GEM8_9PEZI